MRQSLLVEPRRLELREVPDLEPAPGELILSVDLALTCGTDLKTYRRGHPKFPCPTPLGHEFTGTVAAVGAGVTRFRVGDPVLAAPSAPCGECPACRFGLENLCKNIHGRSMAWGAFADQIRVPPHVVRRNVFPRPRSLPLSHCALLEPLSCVVGGVSRLDLVGRETALVLGAGPIGLLFVALLAQRGVPQIVVVGKRKNRLSAARALGADEVIDLDEVEDPGAAVRDLTSGFGACTVVECVGRPEAWSQAMDYARKGGEVLFYGGCAAGTQVPLDTYRMHYDALTLKGAFHFSPSDVRIALDLLVSRGLPGIDALITGQLPLERLQDALEELLAGRAIKLAIAP
ncbi:MAG TPA: hypothetical protein DEA08_25475 [Planctomycetes bacterium]|nr:hypothetical protein [Planctomycetota bacterium]|tara:strand:+ start:110 stop:1144 length:1035 start_codon:yes stop_codon:yes gene_type:complete